MNKSETLSKLAAALVKAQSEIKIAVKDATNPFFKSNYADLPAVIDAIKPALNKHGIAFLQVIVAEGVETVLLHESGEFISGVTPIKIIPEYKKDKSGNIIESSAHETPQALGSAITYAKRYGLQAIVGVPADKDDDAESAMGRTNKVSTVKGATPKVIAPKSGGDVIDDSFFE